MQVTNTQRITKREDLKKLVTALEKDLKEGLSKKKAIKTNQRQMKLTQVAVNDARNGQPKKLYILSAEDDDDTSDIDIGQIEQMIGEYPTLRQKNAKNR